MLYENSSQLVRRLEQTSVRALALAVSLLISSSLSIAAAPFLEKQDLFRVGDNPAYNIYHIPGIVVTAKGTVLAWCEARKRPAGVSDWDDIRILLRRSTDHGKTWSEPQSIANVEGPKTKNPFALAMKNVDPKDVTYNNPVLIAGRNGIVHCVFCLEYMRVFHQTSNDDGVSWSKPVEITSTFESFQDKYPWKVLATGPNHGIELSSGRLLIPVWISTATGRNAHRPSVTSTIYSDDQGKNWKAGDIAIPCTEEWINPNESVVAERFDGKVLINVRNESKTHRRILSVSPDGATDWSSPRFEETLWEPICMAGMTRYEFEGKQLLLFSNPHNLEKSSGKVEPGKSRDRKNLSIKISEDNGETWHGSKLLENGPSAYSDIAVTQDGTILCFYGRSDALNFAGSRLTLARFNLEWLQSP